MSDTEGTDQGRILVVQLDNLGAVALLTPALRALRDAYSDAHLALLTSPAGARLGPLLPWIDEVFVLDALWQRLTPDGGDWYGDIAAISRLRQARFDTAFVFTRSGESPLPAAYFCHLAGIPVRVGESGEEGGATLTTAAGPGSDDEHQADRNLRLLAAAGIPDAGDHLELVMPLQVTYAVQRLLRDAGGDPLRPYAVVAPGAGSPARQWPAERFGQVAAGLSRLGLAAVIVGGPHQMDVAAAAHAAALVGATPAASPSSPGGAAPAAGGAGMAVVAAVGSELPAAVVNLAGRTSVPELAALVAGAALVVTNNSASMHLADAFARPTVVTFAGTEPESRGRPRYAPARLLRRPTPCSPCHGDGCPGQLRCLEITPAEVLAAAADLLHPAPPIALPLAGPGGVGAEAEAG